MEHLKLAIVDSENYNDFATINSENFDRVIVFTNSSELEANLKKTTIYNSFELVPIIYGEGNKDNMDGYICAKLGEYIGRYRDFRAYLTITIYSNDKIFKGIAAYYTRKGYNVATSAPKGCITGDSNTDPAERIEHFIRCSKEVQRQTFKRGRHESARNAFYRLISRQLDKDIPKEITDRFVQDRIVFFSSESRKISVRENKHDNKTSK